MPVLFSWVLKKLHYFAEVTRQNPPKRYETGETFLIGGKSHRLEIHVEPAHRRSRVELVEERLVVQVNSLGRVRKVLHEWYRDKAAAIVQEAVQRLSPALGVSPSRIKIANQKRRWGSCSTQGHLRFNWRLAMMPGPIADYVVVHELAHLRVPNHSKKFWSTVQSVLPDYQTHRRWLRVNGMLFSSV